MFSVVPNYVDRKSAPTNKKMAPYHLSSYPLKTEQHSRLINYCSYAQTYEFQALSAPALTSHPRVTWQTRRHSAAPWPPVNRVRWHGETTRLSAESR